MTADRTFRLSLYATLAVAIFSLGLSGADLLPEMPFVAGLSLVLLVIAYYVEGRWELSLRHANAVGLFMFVFLALWAIYQAVRPPIAGLERIPFPAMALPYFAPVLMVLIPAKMLRPKHTGDYWTMLGLALLAVSLAGAMASEGVFVAFFAVFCLSFVWCLLSFHAFREVGSPAPGAAGLIPTRRGSGLRSAIIRSAVVGIAAIPFFWMTPKADVRWELGLSHRGRAVTGISENSMDLNRTGSLDVATKPVFEVLAEDAEGNAYDRLPLDVRFRVTTLNYYSDGRWRYEFSAQFGLHDRANTPPGIAPDGPKSRLPRFGPSTIFLTYGMKIPQEVGLPLADPIYWRSGDLVPVTALRGRSNDAFVHHADQSFRYSFRPEWGNIRYMQSWVPDDSGPIPYMRVNKKHLDYLTNLPRTRLSGLIRATEDIISHAVSDGTLPKEVLSVRDSFSGAILPKHHAAVAEVLEQHLRSSGKYSYSLDLKRQDRKLDPAEDFILHTRSGHCQRFATVLALMLRSQGIPCQIILGYRGLEQQEQGGYLVREDHAHAWVEVALIEERPTSLPPPRTAGPLPDDVRTIYWRSFDPTPSGSLEAIEEGGGFIARTRKYWEDLLRSFVVAYDAETRAEALRNGAQWFLGGGWLWPVGAIVLIVAVRRIRRHRRARNPESHDLPPAYAEVLGALDRTGRHRTDGFTHQEYIRHVTEELTGNGVPSDVSATALHLVNDYYARRFGQRPGWNPPPEDLQRLLEAIRGLTNAGTGGTVGTAGTAGPKA